MPLIAVSILNFRGGAATVDCVKSLLAEEMHAGGAFQFEIHVTDNGSGDGESALLTSSFADQDNVHLRFLDRNHGFSAGHNANLRRIFSGHPPDYVWLLNNDCVSQHGCTAQLLECAASRPEVAIWGATLLEADGSTVQ